MNLIRNSSVLSFSLAAFFLASKVSAVEVGTVGDTKLSIKGYIKLDAIMTDYDSGQTEAGRDFYVPKAIPVGDAEGATSFDMHARQSRIAFQTDTDLGTDKLKTYLEWDFYGGGGNEVVSNYHGLGIRHAFFSYNNWLFGQTWSTFMDTSVFPETLDFIGNTDAMPFVRQAQIRYTNGGFQFALENSETTIWGGPGSDDDSEVPDIVVKYSLGSGDFKMSAAAVLRQLNTVEGTVDSSTNGYGVQLSGSWKLGKDDVKFLVTTGSGLGRYVAIDTAADTFVDSDGELEAIDTTTYYAAYRHFWSDTWRSTISYSAIDIDDTGADSADWTTESYSVRANLLTSPLPNLTIGGEFTVGEREVQNGSSGEVTKLQFSAKLTF